jgi:hypothetical protein
MKVRAIVALFFAGLMLSIAACNGKDDIPKIKGTPDSRLSPTVPAGGGVAPKPAPMPT